MNLQSDIYNLFHRQLQNWELAKNNFEALKNVRKKSFDFDFFKITIYFNPARAVV